MLLYCLHSDSQLRARNFHHLIQAYPFSFDVPLLFSQHPVSFWPPSPLSHPDPTFSPHPITSSHILIILAVCEMILRIILSHPAISSIKVRYFLDLVIHVSYGVDFLA